MTLNEAVVNQSLGKGSAVNETAQPSERAGTINFSGSLVMFLATILASCVSVYVESISWHLLLITPLGIGGAIAMRRQQELLASIKSLSQVIVNPDAHYRDLPVSALDKNESLKALKTFILSHERQKGSDVEHFSELVHMAKELTASATASAENADSQKQAVASSAAAVTELSQSIEDVALQVKNAHEALEQCRVQTAKGSEGVQESASAISGMVRLASESTQLVEKLFEQSTNVAAMSKIIRDIAEQTNLLSLNAAIESARAGEHGRGFAVVADEVRNLSMRSRESADEITESINNVQEYMQELTKQADEVVLNAQNNSDSINHVGGVIEDLNRTIDELTSKMLVITASAEQQSIATNEISENVEALLERANQNADIADETVNVAKYLADRAEQSRQQSL